MNTIPTTATVNCTPCGQVSTLPATSIRIINAGGLYSFTFRCPSCGAQNMKRADATTLRAMQPLGMARIDLPPQRTSTDAALTEDDLLTFGAALEACADVFGALL